MAGFMGARSPQICGQSCSPRAPLAYQEWARKRFEILLLWQFLAAATLMLSTGTKNRFMLGPGRLVVFFLIFHDCMQVIFFQKNVANSGPAFSGGSPGGILGYGQAYSHLLMHERHQLP